MMRIFKSKQIQKLSGASKIQLVHWINIGAIEPYEDDRRRGGVRKFNQQNLIEACICKKLNDLRIPAQSIASALKSLRSPISGNNPQDEIFWDIFKKTFKKQKWYLTLVPATESTYSIYNGELVKTKSIDEIKKHSGRQVESHYYTDWVPKGMLQKFLDRASVSIIVDLNKIVKEAGGV